MTQTEQSPEQEKIAQLRALGAEVRDYQLERGWSNARVCSEIGHLGSTKTYARVIDPEDNLDDLSVDNQIRAYTDAIALIQARRSKDLPAETVYEDFTNVRSVRAAIVEALQEDSIARFVCVEGENGCGKDAACDAMLRRWPKISRYVEAHEFWRDSISVPITETLRALRALEGDVKLPHYPSERQDMLVETLNKRKTLLLINEFHRSGPRALNMVTTLINQTPTVIVIFCVPALLSRLIKSGYEEARQLFGNRLCRRVRLDAPDAGEIIMLLNRRGVKFVSRQDEDTCAKQVAENAPHYGNWRFVSKVARRARAVAAGNPIDMEKFIKAMTDTSSACIEQQRKRK